MLFRRIRVENIDQLASTAALSLAVSGRTAAFSPLIFEIHIMVWDTGYCRTIDMNAIGDDAGTFLRTSIRQEYGVYRDEGFSGPKTVKYFIEPIIYIITVLMDLYIIKVSKWK